MAEGRPDPVGHGEDRASTLRVHQMVGGYELLQPIGAGAHGTVWRARSTGALRAEVAIKVLHESPGSDDLVRLEREAAVLAQLDHPNIVRVIDLITEGGNHAIVTELAVGGSLADRLASGTFDPREVVALLGPVASALHSTHRHGLVHGDVKPANILLTSEGQPLLADFGVADWLGTRPDGNAEGTLQYLAPELAAGSPPSVRTDVFALGVVAHEMLLGQRPHPESGWSSPLLDVPISDALARLITRACSRDSAERVESARTFGELLARTPEAQPGRGTDSLGGSNGAVEPTRTPFRTSPKDPDGDTRPFGPPALLGAGAGERSGPGRIVRAVVITVVAVLVALLVAIAVQLGG